MFGCLLAQESIVQAVDACDDYEAQRLEQEAIGQSPIELVLMSDFPVGRHLLHFLHCPPILALAVNVQRTITLV